MGVRPLLLRISFEPSSMTRRPPPGISPHHELHVQTRLASQAIGLEGLRREEGAGRPAPLLTFRPVGVGGERPAPIKTSGPRALALRWSGGLPARACGLRSSAPSRRRFRNHRRISEAQAPKHIPRSPSSSVYIHHEPRILIPAPQNGGLTLSDRRGLAIARRLRQACSDGVACLANVRTSSGTFFKAARGPSHGRRSVARKSPHGFVILEG